MRIRVVESSLIKEP